MAQILYRFYDLLHQFIGWKLFLFWDNFSKIVEIFLNRLNICCTEFNKLFTVLQNFQVCLNIYRLIMISMKKHTMRAWELLALSAYEFYSLLRMLAALKQLRNLIRALNFFSKIIDLFVNFIHAKFWFIPQFLTEHL